MPLYVDADYHKMLRDGIVAPPNKSACFMNDAHGGYVEANSAARAVASRYSAPWRNRYQQSPLWVVSIPGGYAVVPNGLYSPNLPWRDLCDDMSQHEEEPR